jgi:DNA-binding response OmpR family regulator
VGGEPNIHMPRILIIEENRKWRETLKEFLIPSYHLTYWPDDRDIATILNKEHFEIVLLNIHLEQADSFGLLKSSYTHHCHQ